VADVTVITPFRDAAAFIPGLIANLRAQSHNGWRALLIDHGSQDGGGALARQRIEGDPRFRLISLPRRFGFDRQLPAIPRNHALAEVSTPLVAFLDVDDLWHPQKLERQLRFHREQGLDLSVTSYCRFREPPAPLGPWRCPPIRLHRSDLQWRNPIPMLTVIASRTLLRNGFPLHPHEDYLLWLELWRDRPRIRYGCLPELLAFYRCHGSNISRGSRQLARWTYGVYRASGIPPVPAFAQLLRWGLFHVWRQGVDRLCPVRPAGTLPALMEQAPLRWPR
jgi:teichuronic acid biosynthesis glycosyltransferase TuaG